MTEDYKPGAGAHPITPPPELVQQWMRVGHMDIAPFHLAQALATQAARWGFDQRTAWSAAWLEARLQEARDEELEAIIHWIVTGPYGASIATSAPNLVADLRVARRPKPPSLKEQALKALDEMNAPLGNVTASRCDTIRRALEQLDD